MYDKLKDTLHKEMEEFERKSSLSVSDLEKLKMLSGALKNISEICLMEEARYSEGGYYDEGMDYGRGASYANRGKHYVRGHYSRDGRGGQGGGYSSRRDSRGRYSREDGRSEMMEHLEMAMETANEQDRENIKRWMRQLESA